MSTATKDTIYIDIDDEITSIIDKVQASKHKIVALVLPKRAATLQSIVNMKLLKRTGKEADKRIVLITSEASLLPLAGIVGLHTAKTLQSKPVIPPPPDAAGAADAVDDTVTDSEPEIDASKSIGELAGLPDAPEHNSLGELAVEETIDVDNTEDETAVAGKKASKKDKKGKIKIPNFESFRLRLFLAVFGFLLLIVGWVMAFNVLPKVRVVVKTDTTNITSSINFTAQTDAKEVDIDKSIVPAETKEVKKTDSLKVTATGQKNTGQKSTGTVTLKNCTKVDVAIVIPAGTGVSTNNLTFITQADITLPASTFSGGGSCTTSTGTVSVTAQNAGNQYNLSGGRTFSVSGYSGVTGVDSSSMKGGTTINVTVISQQDIDGAKAQLIDKSKDAATAELTKIVTDAKLLAFASTVTGTDPAITTSPNIGDEAADVTVTAVTTYIMIGVKAENLQKLVDVDAKKQIDLTKQPIINYGLDKAVSNVTSKRSATDQSLALQTVAVAGTKIDPDALKKDIIGKKKGDVQSKIESIPGVKDVTVNYSPFWVSKVPNKTSRITVIFEQTNTNGK